MIFYYKKILKIP